MVEEFPLERATEASGPLPSVAGLLMSDGCHSRRSEAFMFDDHCIDNCPTVKATPTGKLMVNRPESVKIFKLLMHHQSIAA